MLTLEFTAGRWSVNSSFAPVAGSRHQSLFLSKRGFRKSNGLQAVSFALNSWNERWASAIGKLRETRDLAPARAGAGATAGARDARVSRLPGSQLADRTRSFRVPSTDLRAKERLLAVKKSKWMEPELPCKTLVIKCLNNRKCKGCLVLTADKSIQGSDSGQKSEI